MIIRESVRAVVLDESRQILLSRVTPLSATQDQQALWVTLGGRLREGEELENALKRELLEELGSTTYTIGPKIWLGDEVVSWDGKAVRLIEHFFLVLVPSGNYSFVGTDDAEVSSTRELKWLSASQIAASADRFVPRDLGALLANIESAQNSGCCYVRLE